MWLIESLLVDIGPNTFQTDMSICDESSWITEGFSMIILMSLGQIWYETSMTSLLGASQIKRKSAT